MAGLALGALLGSAVALLASAAASQQQQQRRRVIVGGVDLTGVDPAQPFVVDFSVAPDADTEQKHAALARLRTAFVEIQTAYPYWFCQTEAQAVYGRFVLHVAPLLATSNPSTQSFV